MHQISLEELARHIPRPVRKWDNKDIMKWLQLNDIEIDAHLFEESEAEVQISVDLK